jgi:hypothetical protein
MIRSARWIALVGIAPAIVAGWCLAGWLTPRFLGTFPVADWNAYAAYLQVVAEPAWRPYALRIYLAGGLGLGLAALLVVAGIVLARRRWAPSSTQAPLAFAPARRLEQAGYAGASVGRVLWARRGAAPLSAGGHVLVACHADEAWQRDHVLPNLLHWDGPVLVVDRGGEAWSAASGYRAAHGPTWYVEPFAADGRSAPWNPLAEPATAKSGRDGALRALAHGLYTHAPAHISHEASGAFLAVAGYLLDAYVDGVAKGLAPSVPTLPQVEALFRPSHRSLKHELKRFLDKPFTSGATRTQLLGLLGTPRERFDYLVAMAHAPLRDLAGGGVARALSGKDIDLAQWAAGGGSLHVALPAPGAPQAASWLAAELIERALQALLARPDGPVALCILDGPDTCGPVPSLRRALYEGGARRIRVLQRSNGLGEWSRAYGEVEATRLVGAFDLRVFSGTASPSGVPSALFAFPAGEATRFDHRRWPMLVNHVARQESAMLVALQRGIERPIRAHTLRYAKDPRLAARRLPPVVVSPPSGDDAVPSKTLMTLGASAALALGATACSASGQGGDTAATSEMHAPVYSDKLVEARLGPTTYAFPMNLYSRQVGQDARGGVSLTVRWPSLEAFPPGATNDSAFKDAYMDESIDIIPDYVSKVPIESLPLKYTDASWEDPSQPLVHLGQRVKGEPTSGLVPFYADLDKVADYFKSKGYPSSRERILEVSNDWYLGYDNAGAVSTLIQCDNHLIAGASLVDGKLEKTPVGEPRGMCWHRFTVNDKKLVVRVTYPRAYMKDWKRIELRVRQLIDDAAMKGSRQ